MSAFGGIRCISENALYSSAILSRRKINEYEGMVCKILPEAWKINQRFDSERLHLLGISYPRMEEYLR
jgi:hypothetical protein